MSARSADEAIRPVVGPILGASPTAFFVWFLFARVTTHFDAVDTLDSMDLRISEDGKKTFPYFCRVLVIVELLQRNIKDKLHLTS